MKTHIARIGILLVVGVLAVSAAALADGNVAPLSIIPTPTPQPLSVSIWTGKSTYMIGETLSIHFSVNMAAFIYIYDIQPDGVVRLIFPNAYSQANFVSAGVHTLPDGLYQFTVAPPAGVERLQIFASPVSLGLAPPYFGEPYPLAGNTPGDATGQIQAQIMGITPQPQWATGWTSFTIYQQSYGYTPPSAYPFPFLYPPFFGYPGGTWYYEGGQWHSGMPGSGMYWYFGADGKWHLRIVFRFGSGQ